MNNKRFFWTFSILAVFFWSFTWWGDQLLGWAIRLAGQQYKVMYVLIISALPLALAHVIIQIRLVDKNKASLIAREIVFNVIGLCLLGFWAITVSRIQIHFVNDYFISEFFQALSSNIVIGSKISLLLNKIALMLESEGIELIFCFFLALVSRYIIYTLKKTEFSYKEFMKTWSAWFCIIFINEMVIQNILPDRNVTIWDPLNNMVGITIGLLLSMRWFWRK